MGGAGLRGRRRGGQRALHLAGVGQGQVLRQGRRANVPGAGEGVKFILDFGLGVVL